MLPKATQMASLAFITIVKQSKLGLHINLVRVRLLKYCLSSQFLVCYDHFQVYIYVLISGSLLEQHTYITRKVCVTTLLQQPFYYIKYNMTFIPLEIKYFM